MAPGGTPAFNPTVGLPGTRSALLVTTAAYADAQLAWLRPPVSGAHDLAAALADPRSGGFAVDMLTDGTETEIRLAIGRFLSGRSPEDTVLLYISCHAIRDRARLYFAATDTWLRYPRRSAFPAGAVMTELDRCGAGNRLLILDCCFSGGFAEEKGELDVAAELALDSRGIAVLSASRAREYSYEGRPIGPELPRSVFTEGLAVGLASGAADVDGNGIVTVAEAYNYAYHHVSQNSPRQAPQYYLEDGHGEIVLARGRPPTRPQPRISTTNSFTAPHPGPARPYPADNVARMPQTGPPGQPSAAHAAAADAMILEQDRDNAYCVGFSPDGRLLASGGWGRPVRVRDAVAGGLVRELRSAGQSVYDLAFSADGALIATGSRDGTVALSEVSTGKKVRSRKPGGSAIRAVAFTPDGGLLLSAHEDGVARLWETLTLGRVHELRAEGETIFSAVFSPDGRHVAAACSDGAIRLWLTAGGEPRVFRRHIGWATAVAFSPDGGRLVSSGADGTVQLHDVRTADVIAALRAGDGMINAIALSPDGLLVAAGYETGAVTVWEIASGRHETLPGHAGHVNDVAFSPNRRTLASAGKDGTVRLWH